MEMDDISILLQEAKPLYMRRKQLRTNIKYQCAVVAIVAIFTPIFIHTHKYDVDVGALYAELYSNGTNTEYYIDEFDAIGII